VSSIWIEVPECAPGRSTRRHHQHSHHRRDCGLDPRADYCHRGRHADALVQALVGERRLVPLIVRNDSSCAITVTPILSMWVDCCTAAEKVGLGGPRLLPDAQPFDLQPTARRFFDIEIDTKGLQPSACVCATLVLDGALCEPIRIALCLEEKVPLVAVHGVSKLLTWIRYRCFGHAARRYVAPSPHFCD
jgi:hypothetical protein